MKQLFVVGKQPLLLGLAAMATGAHAGVMGSTSRATVSIGVIVPPHVTVRVMPSGKQVDTAEQTLCVWSSGLSRYHVELDVSDYEPGSRALARAPSDPLLGIQTCGPIRSASAAVRTTSAHGEGAATKPATILIVPE